MRVRAGPQKFSHNLWDIYDGVGLQKSANVWIIISRTIVVKTGLKIKSSCCKHIRAGVAGVLGCDPAIDYLTADYADYMDFINSETSEIRGKK